MNIIKKISKYFNKTIIIMVSPQERRNHYLLNSILDFYRKDKKYV